MKYSVEVGSGAVKFRSGIQKLIGGMHTERGVIS
jgi:hypothetical protein